MWDPEQAIQPELLSSEVLRWTGRPAMGRVLLTSAFPILFSVFWEAIVIHAAVNPVRAWLEAGRPGASLPFAHFAMMAVGLLFMAKAAGPVLTAARTAYGITSRRVVVVSHLTARRVRSVESASIGDVDRTERSNGSGDIVIRPSGEADHSLTLVGVPDIRLVADKVERLRASSSAAVNEGSGLLPA